MRLSHSALLWVTCSALLLAPGAAAAGGGRSGTGSGIQEYIRKLRDVYQQEHPCPSTGRRTGNCPGYFAGFVVLPKHGGKYDTSNMRWMTEDEAVQSKQDMRW